MQEQLSAEKIYRDAQGTPKYDVMVSTLRAGPTLSVEDQAKVLLDKGIAAIPSAHTTAYMKENLDVHTALGKPWRLAAEELTALSKISTPCRGAPCTFLCLPSACPLRLALLVLLLLL